MTVELIDHVPQNGLNFKDVEANLPFGNEKVFPFFWAGSCIRLGKTHRRSISHILLSGIQH